MLLDELVAQVLRRAEGAGLELVDYCAGIRYCYAIVSDGSRVAMGLAHVLVSELGHEVLPERLELEDALELAASTSLLQKALGVAVANAVSQFLLDPGELAEGDILDHLELGEDDRVVLVGYMKPLYEALRSSGLEVAVLERDPALRGPHGLPDTVLPRVLESATVCLATGSCLVNDTVDLVLQHARGCRVVALVGPTAQMLPELLHAAGFTHVASIYVRDARSAAWAVRRGGGTRELLRFSTKYVSISGQRSIGLACEHRLRKGDPAWRLLHEPDNWDLGTEDTSEHVDEILYRGYGRSEGVK